MQRFLWLKPWLKQISAVLIVVSLYFATRLPEISARERLSLSSHFQFQRSTLPQVPGPAARTFRSVNPRLAKISAWISSVGAAVALSDIDGDGLPDDLCYVDVRTDQVIVAPPDSLTSGTRVRIASAPGAAPPAGGGPGATAPSRAPR